MTKEQTATERLRRLLDERGVEWEDYSDEKGKYTSWDNSSCWFMEYPDGYTSFGMRRTATPEQAIAATLGNDGVERSKNGVAERGTCHIVADRMTDCYWENELETECGATFLWAGENPAYCPYCGGKVVE